MCICCEIWASTHRTAKGGRSAAQWVVLASIFGHELTDQIRLTWSFDVHYSLNSGATRDRGKERAGPLNYHERVSGGLTGNRASLPKSHTCLLCSHRR